MAQAISRITTFLAPSLALAGLAMLALAFPNAAIVIGAIAFGTAMVAGLAWIAHHSGFAGLMFFQCLFALIDS